MSVPLGDIQNEWYKEFGRKHLVTVANHFGLYRDIYGMTFEPQVSMEISFDNKKNVYFGNIIKPSEVSECIHVYVCVYVSIFMCMCVYV